MLHNSKGKLKSTNQNLLVSDPAVICVSQIILKCLLMCATLSFFLKKGQPILQSCELCHFPEFLPCHKYFTFFFFSKIASQTQCLCTSHITQQNSTYQCCVFRLKIMCLFPSFAGHNSERVQAMLFRSPLPSGLAAPQ